MVRCSDGPITQVICGQREGGIRIRFFPSSKCVSPPTHTWEVGRRSSKGMDTVTVVGWTGVGGPGQRSPSVPQIVPLKFKWVHIQRKFNKNYIYIYI